MRRPALVAVVIALALTTACSSLRPTPPGASPATTAQPTPVASPPSSSSNAVSLSIHAIGQKYTTPVLATATDGTEIAWSRGAGAGDVSAWQLWAVAATGGSVPRLVYSDPQHDAQLLPIAVAAGGYAWVEQRASAPGEWWLWYLAPDNTHPIQLDHGTSPDWPLPSIALGGGRLVWAAVHASGSTPTSELISMNLASSNEDVLRSAPADQLVFTWPSIAANRLTYATVQGGVGGVRHVMQHDFDHGGPDRQLDDDGRASLPASSDTSVVWKSADSEYNWGDLIVYLLGGGPTRVAFGNEQSINYPSVGERYVAAWAWDDTQLWVYDLRSRRSTLIEEFPPTSPSGDVRPMVADDLLVWLRAPQTEDGQLTLMWARLPAQ